MAAPARLPAGEPELPRRAADATPATASSAAARRGRRRLRGRAAGTAVLVAALALGVAGLARSAWGDITTVAGGPVAGFAGDGGPATSASLDHAAGVALAADGVMYIADTSNHRIRRVGTDGTITTFAGSGAVGLSGDGGPATAAAMNTPRDVAVDGDGAVYVADTFNDVVRRIDTSGVITTVAGTGTSGHSGDTGPATSLKLSTPGGVAVAADGDLLIADTGNNRIRRVDSAGQMTTVAGTGSASYGGDGGPATSAQVKAPADVTPYGSGGFVIADTANNRVRSVSANGTITTLAGTGVAGGAGDGGLAIDAQLRGPVGVIVGGTGAVYIADTNNHRIRRVSISGYITAAAGTGTAGFSGDGGGALFAKLNAPQRLASGTGGLYLADSANSRIRFVEGIAVTVPAPTLSAVSPAGPANDNAPEVTGTAVDGSTVRLYTDASCSSAVAATGTAVDFASPGLTVSVADDSSTTFYATATDANGVKSWCSSSSVSYTEDSTPPGAASISEAPATPATDTTPTWSFSGPATLECRLDGPAGEIAGWAACASPWTAPALTTDGAHTFSVRTRDAAGNTSTPATSTYTLDRVAPGAPSIGTAPAAETNDATPTFAFSAETGATFRCRLWRETTPLADWAACSSPHTPDISAEIDGSFTFRVRAVDAAENVSTEAEAAFTLDRVAPDMPSFTGGTGAVGNDPSPSWTFSLPGDATAECRLDLGAREIAAWDACASGVSYALAGEADGTYTVRVRSRDSAGNRSTAVSRTYELDRVAPEPPTFTAEPPPAGAGTSPTWGFTGEDGATLQCRVTRGAHEVSGWTTCSDPHTVALATEIDGTYTLSIRATDAALNVGDAATDTYTLDREAPAISDPPGSAGNDETPTWSFSGSGAASYECRLVLDSEPVPPWAACSSPKTYDLGDRPDGTYTFSVRALDSLGDPSASVADSYTLDTAAPAAATITEQPSGVGTQAAARWSWTGDAGVTFACRLERDGTPVESFAACTSPRDIDLSGSPDGAYRLAVRSIDAVSNTTDAVSAEYVLDRVAPAPPVYTASPAPSGNATVPSWSFASDAGVAFECRLEREGVVVEHFAACASPHGYDLGARPDGVYAVVVRARDGAGNVAVTRSAPYALDRAGPGAVTLTGSPGAIGNDRTPTWRFDATGAVAFACGLARGADALAPLAGCGGAWTFDLAGERDGAYTFRVRGVDEVGNAGAFVEDGYVLDTTPPAPPQIRGPEVQEGGDESVTWRFTGEAGAILECQLRRGDDVIARMSVCATPRAFDLENEADGTYTFAVRATDAAGNVGKGATAAYRLHRPAPVQEHAAEPPTAAPAGPAPPAAGDLATAAGAPAPAAEAGRRRAAGRRGAQRRAAPSAGARRRDAARDAAAAPTAAPATPRRARKKGLGAAAEQLAEVGRVVAKAVGVAAEKSAFPGLLLAFCGLFLVVQDRIDRRDPKLALAPIDADPELMFLPLDDLAADETEGGPPCPG